MGKINVFLVFAALLHVFQNGSRAAMPSDAQTLLAIKNNLVDSLNLLSSWNATDDDPSVPCSWSGVICSSSTNMVTGLDLSHMNLSGTISDDIKFLHGLTLLNLSSNLFSGALPISLTNATGLQFLDISHNSFDGSFPNGFSRLKSLVSFTAYSNNFQGPLPLELVKLPLLEKIDFGGSYFTGSIPSRYGDFTSLKYLDLSGNSLNGSIPTELGNLPKIEYMRLGWNEYTGSIPSEIGNLSSLQYLDIAGASLSGSIPSSLGNLSNLNTLFLYRNKLIGSIPSELGQMSSLMSLDFSENELTGSIPDSFGNMKNLTMISVMYNSLSGEVPSSIADLPNLELLLLWNNSFSGGLPQQLGFGSRLKWIDVSANNFTGSIPGEICASGKLFKLLLFSNHFSGSIPDSLTSCTSLWRFRVQDNLLTGSIPTGFGSLPNLTWLDISQNGLTGGIPTDLTTSISLQFLDVSNNPLGGGIPSETWKMTNLQKLHASSCDLDGTIPNFVRCPPLISLSLSGNLLSGNIPDSIDQCQKLISLDLSRNLLNGIIPFGLANLAVLSTIDLSHNHLSGVIPAKLQTSTALETFDVSYNNLTGAIPTGGLFKFINASMLTGNPGLCGGVLRACSFAQNLAPASQNKKHSNAVTWVLAATIFSLAFLIVAIGFRCFYMQYKWHMCEYMCSNLGDMEEYPWKLTAFQRLSFTADDIVPHLNSTNIIGMGAAGAVYKVVLPNGDTIAAKKLWRSFKESDCKGRHLVGEVNVLGSIRHRNIVRLLGCCSNRETTLLLYEYMPNGSLGDLLHGNKEANILADWMTRYRIAMGVAQGLSYLHHDCFPLVVHRDIKSNNILLDSNMEARVADFGVAKLIEATETMSVIAGSYGYIAPEYAYTMQVDEKSDIYSFGVVLLELLTGKRPIEPEFGDATNIVEWVREKIQTSQGLSELLDGNVGASLRWVREEMTLVLRVALLCTSKLPMDRPSMRDVVSMLSEAKPRRKNIFKEAIPASPLLRNPFLHLV